MRRKAQIADVAMPIILIVTLMAVPFPVVGKLERGVVGLTSALVDFAVFAVPLASVARSWAVA